MISQATAAHSTRTAVLRPDKSLRPFTGVCAVATHRLAPRGPTPPGSGGSSSRARTKGDEAAGRARPSPLATPDGRRQGRPPTRTQRKSEIADPRPSAHRALAAGSPERKGDGGGPRSAPGVGPSVGDGPDLEGGTTDAGDREVQGPRNQTNPGRRGRR